jgi:hypothetical protein
LHGVGARIACPLHAKVQVLKVHRNASDQQEQVPLAGEAVPGLGGRPGGESESSEGFPRSGDLVGVPVRRPTAEGVERGGEIISKEEPNCALRAARSSWAKGFADYGFFF